MNIQQMLKQAQQVQQRLQEDMARAQEELEDERCEGSAGGGLVSVVVNGHKQLISVKIAPAAVDPNDVQLLEDMVFAATQAALRAAEARSDEVMGAVRGGLNIPGFDLSSLGL